MGFFNFNKNVISWSWFSQEKRQCISSRWGNPLGRNGVATTRDIEEYWKENYSRETRFFSFEPSSKGTLRIMAKLLTHTVPGSRGYRSHWPDVLGRTRSADYHLHCMRHASLLWRQFEVSGSVQNALAKRLVPLNFPLVRYTANDIK